MGGMFRERKQVSGATQGLRAEFSEERCDSQKLGIRKRTFGGMVIAFGHIASALTVGPLWVDVKQAF